MNTLQAQNDAFRQGMFVNLNAPRESMLEMMRGYQHASLQFFTGNEILDVDVICDMSREVQGVILTLTS